MKATSVAVLVVVFCAVQAMAAEPASCPASRPAAGGDAKFLFDGQRAFGYLEQLAVKIGSRVTGSEGEHAAAHYIEGQFKSWGLKTSLQEFPTVTYENRVCTLEVSKGDGKWRAIEVLPVMYSGSTPAEGVEGEIYFIPGGGVEDMGPQMKDKIVLLSGWIATGDFPRFRSLGPKASIKISGELLPHPRHGHLYGEDRKAVYGDLPMAGITHLDGIEIVKSGYTRARLTQINTEKKSVSYNVIGEITGSEYPDEIILITAHYDSHMGISAACDNASGAAMMMELARAFAGRPTKRTLRFVAFGSEEEGLIGSAFYANQLAAASQAESKAEGFNERIDKTTAQKHRLVVNIDMQGAILGRNEAMYIGPDDLGASVRLLAAEKGLAFKVTKELMSSDGTSLSAVGVPALQFIRKGATFDYLHTSMDTEEVLCPKELTVTGQFLEQLLRRYVTDAPSLAFKREIPGDQVKEIGEYFKGFGMPAPGENKKKDEAAGTAGRRQ